MAGLTDLLGTLLQQGMTQSGDIRMSNTIDAGKSDDILGGLLGSLMSGKGGGGLGDLLGGLGGEGSGSGASLDDLLGSLSKMTGGTQAGTSIQASSGGLGDLLGGLLGSMGSEKTSTSATESSGMLGTILGSLLGGGQNDTTKSSMGGGGLGMLASLALSALKSAGETPDQLPRTLQELQKPVEEQDLENDARIIVKAMINAAKADGEIDKNEIDRIIGKLDDDGLSKEEKEFFMTEASKPMDIDAVVASASREPDVSAQIYAASMLAIEVDTAAEQRYMQSLAAGLGLNPQVTAYIENTMGVRRA